LGALGTGIATAGSPIEFGRAADGMARPAVPVDRAGGDQDIRRRPACAPLQMEAGGVPFFTVRATFATIVMSVATEGTEAIAATAAVIAAIETDRMKTAGIVVMTVAASAVKVRVKIVSLRSAVIAVMTVGASAVVIAGKIVSVASAVSVAKPAVGIAITSLKAMGPVADTRLASALLTQARCAVIVVNEKIVAAKEAMKEAAAMGGVEVSSSAASARSGDQQVHPARKDRKSTRLNSSHNA